MCLLLLSAPFAVSAQINQDYFKANQLFRQQEYQDSFQLFQQLYQENPNNFTFLEKATECLVYLKKYDKAISLIEQAQTDRNLQPEANVQLGKIYHIRGDTARALSIWDQTLQEYNQNRQVFIEVARAMKERRAYGHAIKVLTNINDTFSSSRLIASELADTYLLAGQYEKAIHHFLQLVQKNPNQISYVQNRLLRFQDDQIYEIAISEVDKFLRNLSSEHPSYHSLRQLEVWLLMERDHFQEAVKVARTFEEQTSRVTYLLYSLGDKLQAEQQFELAEQSFSYYINNYIDGIKLRSMEEVAELYREWAQYLDRHNVGLSDQPHKINKKAFKILEQLRAEAPDYQRMDKVLLSLSELSLDILHQPENARQYLEELHNLDDDSSLAAQEQYIQGRLYLYNENYNSARVAFTESNNYNKTGPLAEKNLYYLALTDFYAGDFQFAKIQINALQRQNTSYYANDAVQLGLWIQDGLQADSTGEALLPLARAVEYFSQGKHQHGVNELKPLFNDFSNPLADEALLELSKHKQPKHAGFVYQILSKYLSLRGTSSPLYEQLLWERARLADQFVTSNVPTDSALADTDSGEELFIPQNIDQLITLYEKILIAFPNGFYATYVRERIRNLINT